jgi:hypothetical protein
MRFVVGVAWIVIGLTMSHVARAEDEGAGEKSFGGKTPALRIIESHGALPKQSGPGARDPKPAIEGDGLEAADAITAEEHQMIPYRPCIHARGWKNGRLICGQ